MVCHQEMGALTSFKPGMSHRAASPEFLYVSGKELQFGRSGNQRLQSNACTAWLVRVQEKKIPKHSSPIRIWCFSWKQGKYSLHSTAFLLPNLQASMGQDTDFKNKSRKHAWGPKNYTQASNHSPPHFWVPQVDPLLVSRSTRGSHQSRQGKTGGETGWQATPKVSNPHQAHTGLQESGTTEGNRGSLQVRAQQDCGCLGQVCVRPPQGAESPWSWAVSEDLLLRELLPEFL